MTQVHDILAGLDERRRKLGMSESVVAQRAGASLSTVQRTLSGRGNPSFAAVVAIASALGASLTTTGKDVTAMRRHRATTKAERLVRLVQGTSALEGQAVDRSTRRQMLERTKAELLAGPPSRLWAR